MMADCTNTDTNAPDISSTDFRPIESTHGWEVRKVGIGHAGVFEMTIADPVSDGMSKR